MYVQVCIYHKTNLRRRVAVYKGCVPGKNGQSQLLLLRALSRDSHQAGGRVTSLLPASYVIYDSHITNSRSVNLVIRHERGFLLLFIVER